MNPTDSIDSVLKDAGKSLRNALGHAISKSGSIKTNLPPNTLGFWLTQGVPSGLIFAHILMQFVGEIDVGVCFVPSTGENRLDESQIKYVTQFCLNQASNYDCFKGNDTLTDECKFGTPSLCNMNTTALKSNNEVNFFDSLFVYRNYVWFLFIFAFIRGVPQILWSLFFKVEIALAIESIIKLAAEYEKSEKCSETKKTEEMPKDKALKKRHIFPYYVARLFIEIIIDVVVMGLIGYFLHRNNTPYHKLVFICDLHDDRENILLCEIIKNRFISCTVSFGFEFIMTLGLQLAVNGFDLLIQMSFLFFLCCRKTNCCACCKSSPACLKFCQDSKTKGHGTRMCRNLRLIHMLQKINKVDKDDISNVILVEKMLAKKCAKKNMQKCISEDQNEKKYRIIPCK